MPNREPETLGELSRRIERLEQSVSGDFAEVRATCIAQAAQSVSLGVYAAERTADRAEVQVLAARQDKMEGRMTWAWRAAMTSLLGPLITALVAVAARSGS